MESNQLIYLLLIVIGLSIAILIMAIFFSNRIQKKTVNVAKKKVKKETYVRMLNVPLIGPYLTYVRKHIERVSLSDERTIQKRTYRISMTSIAVSIVLFSILLLMDHSFVFVCISVVVVYMIQLQVVRLHIDTLENQLYKEFLIFLSTVRHKYNEHHMVDEAVYEAVDEVPYNMSRHAVRIYNVLMTQEDSIDEYYEVAPNKYFITFTALCQLVIQFGDQTIEGSSSFLRNLNYLKQEISIELLQRQKLNYLLSSLTIICALPFFLIKPLESWATGSMPELMNYYKGTYGYIAQILLFLVVVFSYQLIVKLRKNEAAVDIWGEDYKGLLLGLPKVSHLIDDFMDRHYSKAIKWDRLIKATGTYGSVAKFYERRILMGVATVIVTIFFIVNAHHIEQSHILDKPYKGSDQNMENLLELEALDARYVHLYKSDEKVAIRNHLESDFETTDSLVIDTHYERILDKIKRYENAHFKWWEFVLALCIGIVFSYVPVIVLLFQKGVLTLHMEDEVLTFHTVILMLMPIKRMSVIDLLEWMRIFAVIFKEDIERCLNDYELGDLEALEYMKQEATYEPFIQLIENLQATADKITIMEAFDELIVERHYYQEKRKQDGDILIEKKGSWGKLIAFIPMTGTIIGYLLIPFTHLGLTQFDYYLGNMMI